MLLSKEHHSDTLWYRIVLTTGVIAIPLFGVILKHELPDSYVFMGHRWVMSGAWLLLLALSFTSPFIKKSFITITCWLLFILNFWAIGVVYSNGFSIDYTVGFLTAFCALNITFRRPRLYYPFVTITILATGLAAWKSPDPEIDFSIVSLAMGILGIVFMVTANIIINAEKKLGELNLTLEKKVAERTAEAENQAKLLFSKNKELEQFAYIASHDLKSPLRNIGSFVQLIQRKMKNVADDETKEYMEFVVNNVNKMHTIIEDILQYSRFGDEAISFHKTNIKKLVQGVCTLIEKEIQAKNASVRCHILPVNIRCNARQIAQLFQNLIDNGLKYNESSQPVIDISIRETQTEYLFAIKDNGIGIRPEYQEKIFKIFQRLHTESEYSGTGIGLAICKRIIENHRGEIWIESSPGEGTTFFFTISKTLAAAREADKLDAVAA